LAWKQGPLPNGAGSRSRGPQIASSRFVTWLAVIEQLGAKNLIIGGKSSGSRIASIVADESDVEGLIC
jgi:predicted alpha/beta-hydrolase family hydrolase